MSSNNYTVDWYESKKNNFIEKSYTVDLGEYYGKHLIFP